MRNDAGFSRFVPPLSILARNLFDAPVGLFGLGIGLSDAPGGFLLRPAEMPPPFVRAGCSFVLGNGRRPPPPLPLLPYAVSIVSASGKCTCLTCHETALLENAAAARRAALGPAVRPEGEALILLRHGFRCSVVCIGTAVLSAPPPQEAGKLREFATTSDFVTKAVAVAVAVAAAVAAVAAAAAAAAAARSCPRRRRSGLGTPR